MRERPILFSAPMVRAILAGAKTQTRRPVKPRKDRAIGCELACYELADEFNAGDYMNAPWAPGDRLWVRETFCDHWHMDRGVIEYRADGELDSDMFDAGCTWRPSIHMPRWASRITLEVTGVRVEQLQEISYEDAKAEGAEFWRNDGTLTELPPCSAHRYEFEDLWTSINGADSWDANPWVWVVSFRRLDAKEAKGEPS